MEELREEMVVVWFKRDLRLIDHAPIVKAQKENLPILFIYCFYIFLDKATCTFSILNQQYHY